MPQGVVGTLQRMTLRRRSQAKPAAAEDGVTAKGGVTT